MTGARSLLLVGCGAMAGAMLHRWLDSGFDPARVTVVRPSGAPVATGVRVETSIPDDLTPAMILLGVKPAMIDAVAADVDRLARRATILVSILAGVDIAALRDRFSDAHAIVRAMPNLPVRTGRGVVALHADAAEAEALEEVADLMAPLGLVERIADERQFDAVTALAGSGPAFLYRFVDALAAGGAALGLDADQATRLASATVTGAAELMAATDLPPATLADRVASKGGSTRAGLDVLDEADVFDALVARTLAAAQARNRAMGARAAPDRT